MNRMAGSDAEAGLNEASSTEHSPVRDKEPVFASHSRTRFHRPTDPLAGVGKRRNLGPCALSNDPQGEACPLVIRLWPGICASHDGWTIRDCNPPSGGRGSFAQLARSGRLPDGPGSHGQGCRVVRARGSIGQPPTPPLHLGEKQFKKKSTKKIGKGSSTQLAVIAHWLGPNWSDII